MASLTKTSLSGQQYVDYSYDSEFLETGELKTVEGYEAVQNALILWLYSLRGERIRMPSWGGYVTRWLFKPLTADTAENLQFCLTIGLREEFTPKLNIKTVSVIPDFENDSWIIEIDASLASTSESIHVIENIRRIV